MIPSPGGELPEFLATRDLDRLAEVREWLGTPSSATEDQARRVISAWADRQAVANLLMYPELIPADLRVTAVVRGLSDASDGYLRLAAAVGAGDLGPDDLGRHLGSGLGSSDVARGDLGAETRAAERPADRGAPLRDVLLDLVASDVGPAAIRAASTLATLATADHTADLVVLLRHPEPAVRHNLVVGLCQLLGDRPIAHVLADRSVVAADDAAAAAAHLAEDGVDISVPAARLRMLAVLPYLPNLDDWDRPGEP